jgi:hypothetical protein
MYPPIDAVQEFRMETSAADARYGHGGGGTINLVIKSGTSGYHVVLFEFLRNSTLDARSFFDQLKPDFRMNQFGGSFSGPLRQAKEPGPSSSSTTKAADEPSADLPSTVPTPTMRSGDFRRHRRRYSTRCLRCPCLRADSYAIPSAVTLFRSAKSIISV